MTRSPRHLPTRRVAGMAAAALAVVTLAACGDDGPSSTTTTTTEAPAVETVPNEFTFDLDEVTETLVGMTVEDAEALAEENDWIIRQLKIDGEDQMATMDLRDNRINVAVEDGVITEVLGGG